MKNPRIDIFGTKRWYLGNSFNKIHHRMDGPAVEWYDRDKEWWVAGKLHRLDGPAIEWYDGNKEWFVNGNDLNTISDLFYILIKK